MAWRKAIAVIGAVLLIAVSFVGPMIPPSLRKNNIDVEITDVEKFDPTVDGFQFSNGDFTAKVKKSIRNIKEDFESSSLADEIPPEYWVVFQLLIRGLLWLQKGYCGGMVFTAKQYFENPDQLPPGYLCTHEIPISDPTTTDKIIHNQWVTQAIGDNYLLKWLLLRLGDDPSGLVPMNNEVEWILQQIDNQQVVELTVFDQSWSSGIDWFMAHSVLAYDYMTIGNDICIIVYGPNRGNAVGGQNITLTEDAAGNYKIKDGVAYIETFEITRFGSREAPIWGWTWLNLLNYIDELPLHVIEYIMQEATEHAEMFTECARCVLP